MRRFDRDPDCSSPGTAGSPCLKSSWSFSYWAYFPISWPPGSSPPMPLLRAPRWELVKNHLRYAQSRAMNTETKWGIKFDTPTRYWLFKESATGTIIRLPGVETSDGSVTLANIQISGFPATVSFDFVGSPGASAISPITVQSKLGGSAVGTITITKNTGFIP